MKLELCIQEVFRGERLSFKSQEQGLWLQNVVDLRDVVIGKAMLTVDIPFRLVVFVEKGVLVVSGITSSGGRSHDYLAAWLFIPQEIFFAIDGRKLVEWTNELLKLLEEYDENNLNPFQNFIESLPDIKQEKKEIKLSSSEASNNATITYAMRCYQDEQQLEQSLTPAYMYQPAYLEYEGIMLLDQNDKPDKCKLQDLSTIQLHKLSFVELNKISQEIHVNMIKGENKVLLSKDVPIICYEGDILELEVIHRDNRYLPIQQTYTITENEVINISELEWKIQINPEIFVVVNQDGEQIKDYVLYVNDCRMGKDTFTITEKDAKALQVTFESEGFEKIKTRLNILNYKRVLIEMPYLVETHVYELPSISNRDEPYKLDVLERIGVWKSPIKGYMISGKRHPQKNYRYLKRYIDLKDKLFYKFLVFFIIIGFVLGLFTMWLIMYYFTTNIDTPFLPDSVYIESSPGITFSTTWKCNDRQQQSYKLFT